MSVLSAYTAAGTDANTRLLGCDISTGAVKLFDPSASTTVTYTVDTTLALADKSKIVEMNKATAINLTVPPNSSVAFPSGSSMDVVQYGAGQVTIVQGAGVTIRSKSGLLKLTGQYSAASLYKRATDEWVLFGDLA